MFIFKKISAMIIVIIFAFFCNLYLFELIDIGHAVAISMVICLVLVYQILILKKNEETFSDFYSEMNAEMNDLIYQKSELDLSFLNSESSASSSQIMSHEIAKDFFQKANKLMVVNQKLNKAIEEYENLYRNHERN